MQSCHTLLQRATHQQERDRLWSLYGPSLIRDCDRSLQTDWLNDLLQLDVGTSFPVRQDNIDQTSGKNRRLGHYFESLWQQSLHRAGWRFEAGLRIGDRQHTLGELDLLFEQPDGNHWHIELALKFFLAGPNGWVGPDSRDPLNNKLARLFDHQLLLPHRPDVSTWLAERGWNHLQSQAIVRGCLFYPAHPQAVPPLPDGINPDHWRGYWTHWPNGREHLSEGLWYVLDKAFWCSPAHVAFGISNQTLYQYLDLHFRHVGIPVCVVRVEELAGAGFIEQERWMLVNEDWPTRIR